MTTTLVILGILIGGALAIGAIIFVFGRYFLQHEGDDNQ